MSSNFRSYFCSSARANIPAASGAEAEVPVWVWVHSLWRSALVWKPSRQQMTLKRKSCHNLTLHVTQTDVVTYDPLVSVVSTAVRRSQSGGALLSVPRGQALLGGTADWDSVDAVCVAVTVTVITLAAAVPRCPNKDRAFSTTALQKAWKTKASTAWVCAIRYCPVAYTPNRTLYKHCNAVI